jgi:hypothetical protein
MPAGFCASTWSKLAICIHVILGRTRVLGLATDCWPACLNIS